MEKEKLVYELKEIEFTTVEFTENSTKLTVKNQKNGFKAIIDSEKVIATQFVPSHTLEVSLQIFYTEDEGMIITPDDFIFTIEQDEIIKVRNIPPMYSLMQLSDDFENYKFNTSPSENLTENIGLYYIFYYAAKSAVRKGVEIPFIDQLEVIGNEEGFLASENSELFKKV